MQDNDLLALLTPFLRRHLVPLSLAVVGVILITLGFLPMLFAGERSDDDMVFESGSEHEETGNVLSAEARANSTQQPVNSKITIDVAGAVVKPGVYSLEPDSRVQEAISAAGGFSDKANTEWIAKNLNLAAKLADASKLYIPFVGEEAPPRQGFEGKGASSTEEVGGVININTASQAQLEALPGIGPVTAQKIIAARPYSAIEDLVSKKAVGQSVFEKIKGQISVH